MNSFLLGLALIILAILNLLFGVLIWFKTGELKSFALIDWSEHFFNFSFRFFNSGWVGIDIILDYIFFDINAFFPLFILGALIMIFGPGVEDFDPWNKKKPPLDE